MEGTLRLAHAKETDTSQGQGRIEKGDTNTIRNYVESLTRALMWERREGTQPDSSNNIGKTWGKLWKN